MVEVEKDYASKGVAGAGLGLGIAGTALGLLGNGGIPGLLGGWGGNCNGVAVCHENMPINRYEAGLQAEIAAKDSQIALRDANTYNDQKLLEVYNAFVPKLGSEKIPIAIPKIGTIKMGQPEIDVLMRYIKEA